MAILAGCGSKLPGNLAKNYNFVLMICSIRLFFFGFKANKPSNDSEWLDGTVVAKQNLP
jgi:hypothetical protein